MVVNSRSLGRGFAFAIISVIYLTINYQTLHTAAADTATTQKTSKTTKTMRRKRPRPQPVKPVPLTPLDPVPIETGEGNPLGTFFQALANLESPAADAPGPPVVH